MEFQSLKFRIYFISDLTELYFITNGISKCILQREIKKQGGKFSKSSRGTKSELRLYVTTFEEERKKEEKKKKKAHGTRILETNKFVYQFR